MDRIRRVHGIQDQWIGACAADTYIRGRNQRTPHMAQGSLARKKSKRRATKRIAAKKAANAGTPTAASKRKKTAA